MGAIDERAEEFSETTEVSRIRDVETGPVSRPIPATVMFESEFYSAEQAAELLGTTVENIARIAERCEERKRRLSHLPPNLSEDPETYRLLPSRRALAQASSDARVTAPEVAEILGTTERKVSELARCGKLPGRKAGKKWVFSRRVVQRFLEGA